MPDKKEIQYEVKKLVHEFKKNKEKGEFRNKLGRIWWPVWNRLVVPGASLCGILSGSIPGIIFGAALFSTAYPLTKGFSINVQNIAIKNAGAFGRDLTQRKIPFEIRRQAVMEYLKQSGAWFYNKKWMKENPESIDKMAEGQKGIPILNLVASTEYNLTRAANSKKKNKFSLKERLKIYQQSYVVYQQRRKNIER